MDRLQDKYSLFTKLGALVGPMERLLEYPEQYDEQETAQVVARFCDEYPRLANEFRVFSLGEAGHSYAIQYSQFFNALDSVKVGLEYDHSLGEVLPLAVAKAQSAIDAIPVPPASVILEAGSPFTAYCRLRELCEADATSSLVWLDPYMDASVFHRFLSAVRPTSAITLITCEPDSHAGKRSLRRWSEFLDVSQLFASERLAGTYRLIVQRSLHDRWVVFDDKRIYNLGGSAKDAGKRDYFTISPVDAAPGNLAVVSTLVSSGVLVHSA